MIVRIVWVLAAGLASEVMGLVADAQWMRVSLREAAWKQTIQRKVDPPAFLLSPDEFKRIQRLVWTYHYVKNNDNIWKLAMGYGTSAESLQSSNAAELIWMKPGSSIVVLNKRGTLHRVRIKNNQAETLGDVARFYKGKNFTAEQKLKEEIVLANRLPGHALLTDFELNPGSHLLIPNTYLEFDTFRIPFKFWNLPRVSSGFGMRYHPLLKRKRFHDGLDFPQPHNTPVYASRSGRVIFADWKEGYGLTVIIKHTDQTTSRYGHMSRLYVKEGQWVEAGKKMIGRVGSTGISTGPHLHFEIRDHLGRAVNPRKKLGRK
ncbi:MAG: M23 family metallopeptidase [Elusimicrobiota bacterium]